MSKLVLKDAAVYIDGQPLDVSLTTIDIVEEEVDVTAFGQGMRQIRVRQDVTVIHEGKAGLVKRDRETALREVKPEVREALQALFDLEEAAREQGRTAVAEVLPGGRFKVWLE